MPMPVQDRGTSKQDHGTPPALLAAACAFLDVPQFGWDLAATAENTVVANDCYFSPEIDSLKQDWPAHDWWNWLNPPFANIKPWVQKAYHEANTRHVKTAMLVPASVGSNWWRDFVHEKAFVMCMNGRPTFVGEFDPYPKDTALLLFTPQWQYRPRYTIWSWMHTPRVVI